MQAQFHLRLEQDLKDRFDRIPAGARALVLRGLIDWFCDMYDKYGDLASGAVMSGNLQITNVILERSSQDGTPSTEGEKSGNS